jgi:cobalt-zinc-cadmium efflux system protein
VLSQAIDFEQQREMKQQIAEKLSPFNLAHTTIEFELADEVCRDHRHEHKAH